MKNIIITLFYLLIITSILAQAPQAFKYQTVVRNSSNQIIPNQAVSLKISILQGSATGTAIYVETHAATTNALGIVNLNIGQGTFVSGSFTGINWATNSYFVKIEIDPTGGTTYQLMGTSQLLSVPYALHAKTAESVSYTETDPVFGASPASGITSGNISNWNTAFGWGNHATAGYLTGNQTITLSGDINGSGTTSISTTIANSAVTTAKIANTAVAEAKLADNAVTANKIASNAVTTTKIADNAVTIAKLPAGATVTTFLRGDGTWATPAGASLPIGMLSQTLRHDGTNWIASSFLLNNGTGLGVGASPIPNNQLYLYRPANNYGANYTNIYAERTGHVGVATGGASWAFSGIDAAIKGLSNWGNNYSAALAGYGVLDYANSAAVIGSNDIGSMWGALAFNDGINLWAGYFTGNVNVTGTMRLQGGAPGAGKVLTSDATGNASWQNPAALPLGAPGYTLRHDGTNWLGNNLLYNDGTNIGIGTTSPQAKLHVAENNTAPTGLFGDPISTYFSGTNVSIGDNNADALIHIGQSVNNKGFIIWNYNIIPSSAFLGIGTYGGANPLILQQVGGKVGIGSTVPEHLLHIQNVTGGASSAKIGTFASSYDNRLFFGDATYAWVGEYGADDRLTLYGSQMSLSIGSSTGAAGQVLTADGSGLATWQTPTGGSNWTLFGSNIYRSTGNVGIVTTNPSYKLHVQGDAGQSNLVLAYNTYSSGVAGPQSSIYGYLSAGDAGSGYGQSNSRNAVIGYAYYGYNYTFGVAGYTYADVNRTGGVFGGSNSSNPPTAWGSLGYKTSGNTHVAVYGSAAYASGAGYSAGGSKSAGVGLAGYGDMLGSWSKGEVMGIITQGELFAQYNVGNVFTSGTHADIVQTDNGKVAAFSVTSHEMLIYDRGYGTLQGTEVFVAFDKSFSALLNAEKPVVTITPIGHASGIYLKSVNNSGFTVAADNSSTNEFAWIAVGERIDAGETSFVPQELLNEGFDENLNDFMFNESIRERDAKAMWWDGNTLHFGTLPEYFNPKNVKKEE